MEQTNTLKWVTAARVVGDYLLELDFNDGRRVVFDCQPLISQYKLFAPLRDKDVFARFALDGWTVTWLDGTVDIAPEHLYELGKAAVDFEKLDEAAHYIPSGMNVWEGRQERFDQQELRCYRSLKDAKRLERSLGTTGRRKPLH